MERKLTVADIKSTLQRAGDTNSVIFRPTTGRSFLELDYNLVCKALEELRRKSDMVAIGLDEPSACDKMLTYLFVAHAKYTIG